MAKKLTMRDLAAQFGVSRATISRALNGSTGVSENLRNQIFKVAKDSGYFHKTANSTNSNNNNHAHKNNIVGLIYGDVRNPFYADLTFFIQRTLASYGYYALMFNSEYDIKNEQNFISVAKKRNLAGLMLFTTQNSMNNIAEQLQGMPTVFVNRTLDLNNYDSVTTDNFKVGYIATMHLINLGHKNIAFVKGHTESSASTQRYYGFIQAMQNFYQEVNESFVYSGNLKLTAGHEIAEDFFKHEDHPTAIIFGNDLMALGFIDWCYEHKICIPDDVSIIGCDNIDMAAIHPISLTTISQNAQQMGETAAKLLINRIENPDSNYQRIIIEPRLIERSTVQAVKA